jgi:hypothetical protein
LIVLDYSKESKSFFLLLKGAISRRRKKLGKTKDDGIALTGKVELFPGSLPKTGQILRLTREKTPNGV